MIDETGFGTNILWGLTMNNFLTKPTKESSSLLKIAQDFAQQCPLELGEEIMVVGSVAQGNADAHSDLDIEILVKTLPSTKEVRAWLEAIGAIDLIFEDESGDEAVSISCQYQGVWLEASWHEINKKEKLIQTICAGQNTTRLKLLQIGNVFTAVPLRTSGSLKRWQQHLSTYPDAVQKQVILDASAFWTFPHRVEMLWVLARRGELLGLTIWLTADVSDALRILFAINRQWEMDWKHLHTISKKLAIKPDNLEERVDAIFLTPQLEQRVETTLRLIIDILHLVPVPYDVTKATVNIERSLKTNS